MTFENGEIDYSTNEMKISIEEFSGFQSDDGSKCFIVKVIGEVNIFSAKNLKTLIEDIAKEGNRKICLDFADLRYLDSSGIAVLIGAYALLRRINSDLILFSIAPQIDRIFEMTRLKPLFKIAANADEATRKAAGKL
ncbi:anti-sigma factor antagonist [Leptospira gomenensis]|uniref:Anti-sigma factor antagonist n=1 Tax=Leptospira gomenensis TaxID=2484974 RepID=A0A5F1YU67_9LEPT|nr:STAS domain-containing protein [Leptospira gomenensis]TGK31776.1 anti-sigma factor antagonist [Leptospira gomenensis]TGK41596.1 anti-sigma factor antagonist [Leptospira gomenensis]TGK44423.1 anti-sigma factor antagonist [Leptospira gomenensis]TGK61444.1 anti-sigma factor antagonist [Leptospira gomenensis]